MDLRIKFKPRKYTIKAQDLNWAYYQINDMLYVYNVESFKRGKYRKNKHYDVYIYSIPMQLLDIVKMDVCQHNRNFTIKML